CRSGSLLVTLSSSGERSLLKSAKPFAAAIGNLDESFNRGSWNRPFPCISSTATNAFQYVTVPQAPLHVCWLNPARPYAFGMSVAPGTWVPVTTPSVICRVLKAFPSRNISASNLPGPQLLNTASKVGRSTPRSEVKGVRSGADPMIFPTLRSRFVHPSSRRPTPKANELSTVEWQRAQVIPTEASWPPAKNPLSPTTALSLRRSSVVAGSSRFTRPARSPATTEPGSASRSTLSPRLSAALGLIPGPTPPKRWPSIARCSCSCPPQKSSSPKVWKLNVSRP